jgi:hypothetical protein
VSLSYVCRKNKQPLEITKMNQIMKRKLTSIAVTLILGLSVSVRATVTGQWDFNSGDFTATTGTDLSDFGYTPTTVFTTATIGGSTANVMGFPACANDQGYVMTHGIAPNGGGVGLYVNKYTLIMDIMFPTASSGKWRTFLQTNTGNSNDGDLFVNTGNGIGVWGDYTGSIVADTWHRVAFVFDLTLSAGRLRKYIDGTFVGAQDLDGLDGTWALDPTALLFTDNDGDTAAGFVNSIQIHDVPLSGTDIFALGGATAAGIPATIPEITDLAVTTSQTNATSVVGMNVNFAAIAVGSGTYTYQWYKGGVLQPSETSSKLYLTNIQSSAAGNYTVVVNNGLQTVTNSPPIVLTVNGIPPAFVTGQWDFNASNLVATCGQPLQYFDATVQADTSFGTTTSYGISDITGQPATVMYCAPSVSSWGGLIVTHGIAPNGGGTNVNQYTVIIDLLYPAVGWSSLWQTDVTNASDGEAFFNGSGGLGVSGQYNGALSPGVWHRVVLAYDLTRKEFSKYVDGVNLLSGVAVLGLHDSQILSFGVDERWSLLPTALLLADEDGDLKPAYISSVQVRNGRMTDASVAAMGAPTANKIPGSIKAVKSGSNIIIEWTGSVLESALSPIGPWTEVTGAAHPYPVTSPTGNQFFRVRQ